ncbi:protein trapped in endoderm-1-like [Aphidius gifuensis]|uniref:protein trapped in endoderm-1-like n=1 Tax=Aphidius gifuensis TaxID=684658 RepID=UPI001CDD626D|nr:protein trapped in endoderm-1-like [Aphidius gifuensis]
MNITTLRNVTDVDGFVANYAMTIAGLYSVLGVLEIYGKIYTSRNVKIMIAFIWIIPFFIFAMAFTELYGKVGQSSKSLICTMLRKDGHDIRLISTLASFIIPFTVTSITFLLIYKKVRFNDSTKESNGQENEVNDLSMFKIMLVIFICLLICYLPKPLLAVFDDNRDYPKVNVIGESIYWTHVFTNPIIFFFTGKLYREAYRQMMFSSGKKKTTNNQATM